MSYKKLSLRPDTPMNYLEALLSAITPSRIDALLLSVGATLGAAFSFLFGDNAAQLLTWLAIFVGLDYATGVYAALRTGTFSSRIGYIGIPKKIFIFLMVALCHGLDVACGFAWCEQLAIFAYCVNEFGSLVENIIRAGHGDLIPNFIHRVLSIMHDKVDASLEEKENDRTRNPKQ